MLDRVAEIDKMFETATGWGSWMVEASHERKALIDKLNKLGLRLPHKYTTEAD